jgi:hypothetical protein
LSNLPKELSLLQAPAKTGENVEQNTEMSMLPSGCGGLDDHSLDIDLKDSVNDNDLSGVSSREKIVAPSPDAANQKANLGNLGLDPCMDTDIGKVPTANYELRPLLRMLAGSSSSDFDLSGSISKILDDQREMRELLRDFDPPSILISTRRQAYKDSLQQGILNPDNIEVSFESFPYYLRYKNLLLIVNSIVSDFKLILITANALFVSLLHFLCVGNYTKSSKKGLWLL